MTCDFYSLYMSILFYTHHVALRAMTRHLRGSDNDGHEHANNVRECGASPIDQKLLQSSLSNWLGTGADEFHAPPNPWHWCFKRSTTDQAGHVRLFQQPNQIQGLETSQAWRNRRTTLLFIHRSPLRYTPNTPTLVFHIEVVDRRGHHHSSQI